MKTLTLKHKVNPIDKPIKVIKHYSVVKIEYEDGSQTLHRENANFNSLELLGLLTYIKDEVFRMVFADKIPKTKDFVTVSRKAKNCTVATIKEKENELK